MATRLAVIAEDEPQVRTYIVRVLRTADYEVLEARNGIEALELIHSVHGAVDLLVTDIVMPRMDGNRLATFIRRDYPLIPILLVTGFGGPDPNDSFEVIPKPFLRDTLLEAVARATSDGGAGDERRKRHGGT